MARGLKFRITVVEGLYYPCSENKGADQLRGYREADLRLCFRICKNPVFSRCGSFICRHARLSFSVNVLPHSPQLCGYLSEKKNKQKTKNIGALRSPFLANNFLQVQIHLQGMRLFASLNRHMLCKTSFPSKWYAR